MGLQNWKSKILVVRGSLRKPPQHATDRLAARDALPHSAFQLRRPTCTSSARYPNTKTQRRLTLAPLKNLRQWAAVRTSP